MALGRMADKAAIQEGSYLSRSGRKFISAVGKSKTAVGRKSISVVGKPNTAEGFSIRTLLFDFILPIK